MNLKIAFNVKCIFFPFLHLSELCFVNTNDLNKTITNNDTIDHDFDHKYFTCETIKQ